MNKTSYHASLFEPRVIAFIGASTNIVKWGFNILHHLVRGGYAGEIYPINPEGGTWFGRPLLVARTGHSGIGESSEVL